jgi:hypothetical protein
MFCYGDPNLVFEKGFFRILSQKDAQLHNRSMTATSVLTVSIERKAGSRMLVAKPNILL